MTASVSLNHKGGTGVDRFGERGGAFFLGRGGSRLKGGRQGRGIWPCGGRRRKGTSCIVVQKKGASRQ